MTGSFSKIDLLQKYARFGGKNGEKKGNKMNMFKKCVSVLYTVN
jgi:hypothetical protein